MGDVGEKAALSAVLMQRPFLWLYRFLGEVGRGLWTPALCAAKGY